METAFTVKRLRERLDAELETAGASGSDGMLVEVWTRSGGHKYSISDVVFDDGVISIEVEPVD